jgi:hypothetical protein
MSLPVPRYYEVLRVFIACPGDLSAERSRFPRILDTVNTLRAHTMGFHFEAVGWERVVPSTGRPQGLINSELRSADLVLVVFWNHVGSLSGAGDLTGTMEELEIAKKMCGFGQEKDAFYEIQHPSLYVYFRAQTEPDNDSARRVNEVRKALENSKQLLYRQYSDENEWETLLREHLVAFLNGRKRKDIEGALMTLPPPSQVMRGRFLWQSSYEGGVLRIVNDFDGDGVDETVTFRFQQTRHWVTFEKGKVGYEISPDEEFMNTLNGARAIHLAVKDVTNDGIPELLIAADRGDASAQLSVWGMNDGRFAEIAVLNGQFRIYVYEGGHIVMPYGSVGLYFDYRWNRETNSYDMKDLHDPLRARSAF